MKKKEILTKKPWILISFLFLVCFSLFLWYLNDQKKNVAANDKNDKTDKAIQKEMVFEPEGRITFQSDRDGDADIYIMDPQGKGIIKLTDNNAFDGYPKWSRDGKKISFESNRSGSFQIYIMDSNGKNQKKVTDGRFNNRYPNLSPDGKKVAYQSRRKNGEQIYVMDLETKKESALTNSWYKSGLPNWSSDGKKVAFTANKLFGWGVYIMDRDGSNIRALDTKGGSCRPHWSKDGKRIAYVSQEADKKGDIWLINPDGSEKKRLTTDSVNYDYYPSWSRDGKWIVYANTSHKKKGNWEIRIINVINGQSKQITHHPAQDKFPDWY
ncbi:MAG TPA: hypothetical protein ENI07_02245 [Desulfobacterales bacterium]|nr:hypothetical protein [Desulfobacterales bacterium]